MQITSILHSLLLISFLLGACSNHPLAPDDLNHIEQFIDSQIIPDRQATEIILRRENLRLTFFSVKYGSPQDCESGCFFFAVYGVKCGERIGWIHRMSTDRIGLEDQTFFDVESTDTALFNTNMWSLLESADTWTFWSALLPLLASDPDTPEPTLLAIANRLTSYIADSIAWCLLDNPVVQESAEILTVLATLPGPTRSYEGVRERAQELLDALSPGH